MRMTASWSGSERTYRIQVCGVKMRPNGELPSDLYGDIHQSSSHAGASQKRPLAVHRPSACSGVKALRNTSDAKRQSRQALLAFRSLDPFRALREPDRRRRDEERPFPAPNKDCQQKPKQQSQINCPVRAKSPLTGESPIQVTCEPDFFDRRARGANFVRRHRFEVVAALFRTWSPYLDDLEPFPAQRTGQHYGVEKNLSMVAFPSKFVGAVLAALTVSTAALAQSYYDDQACRQFALRIHLPPALSPLRT